MVLLFFPVPQKSEHDEHDGAAQHAGPPRAAKDRHGTESRQADRPPSVPAVSRHNVRRFDRPRLGDRSGGRLRHRRVQGGDGTTARRGREVGGAALSGGA